MKIVKYYLFDVPLFHGSNRGSNPRGDATQCINNLAVFPRKTLSLLCPDSSRIRLTNPYIIRPKPLPTGEGMVNFFPLSLNAGNRPYGH